jgi:fatty acid desaturase
MHARGARPEAWIGGDTEMNIDRMVMRFAGGMVIISLLLAYFFSPWWLLLALFVGLNLLQASFTGFCPLARILKKLGLQPGCAFPK